MDRILLVNSIYEAAANIDAGRKGFAIEGKAEEGRVSYKKGITQALSAFKEAQAAADPQALILAEWTFLGQELEFLEKSDKDSISSLTKAVRFFDDAFLALEAVEGLHYEVAEQTHPHDSEYRIKGFPKDSYQIACGKHQARIKNILKAPGIDPIEKALLKQRLANMSTAQTAYLEIAKEGVGEMKIISRGR
ncbi:hypothetical protein [Treponema sp. R80B11-R83G3]